MALDHGAEDLSRTRRDLHGRLQREVREAHADQLGDAQAARGTQMQHGAVPQPVPPVRHGCVQDRLHLLDRQVPDQAGICFLERDGQGAPDMLEGGRLAIFRGSA